MDRVVRKEMKGPVIVLVMSVICNDKAAKSRMAIGVPIAVHTFHHLSMVKPRTVCMGGRLFLAAQLAEIAAGDVGHILRNVLPLDRFRAVLGGLAESAVGF